MQGRSCLEFPHEALGELSQHLPALDVVRLASVCRAWHEQLGRTVLTAPVRMECWDARRRASATAWLSKNLQRTRDLELVEWDDGPTPGFPATNALRRLSFYECKTLSKLPKLGKCTALQELRVVRCGHIFELPSLRALSQLTRLEACFLGVTRLPSLAGCTALVELEVGGLEFLESLPPSLASCTALKALVIGNNVGNSYDEGIYDTFALPQSLSALTGLTRLHLSGCSNKTLPRLDGFPQLRALHLGFCKVSATQLLQLTACTELAELQIDCCTRVRHVHDIKFIGALLPPLAALQALSSLRLWEYEAERFPDLATGLTGLTKLQLLDCRIQSEQLEPLAGLTALEDLELDRCDGLRQLPSLASCTVLRRLHIISCDELQALPDLGGCTRLEELSCEYCSRLELPPSLASCGQLRCLRISGCSNRQTLPDLSGCTRLEELVCAFSPHVQQLLSAASCGGQLRRLHIRGGASGDLHAPSDLNGCTQLEELSFRDSKQLPGLAACGQLLRRLLFSWCSLSDLPDLSSCAQLQELDVCDCRELRHLPSLASCGQLRCLRISNCTNLQSLPDLSGCTRLRELSCKACPALQLPDLATCRARVTVTRYCYSPSS